MGPLRGFFTAPRGLLGVPPPRPVGVRPLAPPLWVSPHVPSQPSRVSLKATSRWAGHPPRPPVCPLRGCRAPQGAGLATGPPPSPRLPLAPILPLLLLPGGEPEARSWGTRRNYEGGETLVWRDFGQPGLVGSCPQQGVGAEGCPSPNQAVIPQILPKRGFSAVRQQGCPHQPCLGSRKVVPISRGWASASLPSPQASWCVTAIPIVFSLQRRSYFGSRGGK